MGKTGAELLVVFQKHQFFPTFLYSTNWPGFPCEKQDFNSSFFLHYSRVSYEIPKLKRQPYSSSSSCAMTRNIFPWPGYLFHFCNILKNQTLIMPLSLQLFGEVVFLVFFSHTDLSLLFLCAVTLLWQPHLSISDSLIFLVMPPIVCEHSSTKSRANRRQDPKNSGFCGIGIFNS